MIKVSDYVSKFLFEAGLRRVFLVTGGGAMHLNDSFVRYRPFQVTFNHHEQACAMAAEGLFRSTGEVGIVNVTTGPGGLNTLTGLHGQWTDSIPALYISGQVKFETTVASCPELGLRQLGDQEVDIIRVVKPLTKFAECVTDPNSIRKVLERALHEATTGRMGPVWVDIPMNVQGALIDETSLVGAELVSPESPPLDVWPVLAALAKSKRPVVVAGHGVALSRTRKELLDFLDQCRVPVVTTFNGFDLIPSDHPCFCGRIGTLGTRGGNFTLQNADFVLFLGTRNNIRQITYNWGGYANRAVTVGVDIDLAELEKPTFQPDIKIHSDLSRFLPALVRAYADGERGDWLDWLNWAKERERKYPGSRKDHYDEKDRIHPYAFMETWTRTLSSEAVVVAGNGTACVALFQAGIVKTGQRMFWNSGCASMGYDLPAAIGAAVGTESVVWCLAGDGSLQMNIQELATLGQNQFDVKLIYLNNGGYASIRQTQRNFFESQHGCGVDSGLGFPDMEKLALAYGIPYRRTARIEQVAEHAAKVLETKGPVIWEVLLKLDYSFEPKVSSERLPDGRMISKPLEDMYPFLPREEFEANMYVVSEEVGR